MRRALRGFGAERGASAIREQQEPEHEQAQLDKCNSQRCSVEWLARRLGFNGRDETLLVATVSADERGICCIR